MPDRPTWLEAATLVKDRTERHPDAVTEYINLLAHAIVELGAVVDTLQRSPIDADLLRVCEAWPKLPAAIKTAVMALIQSKGK